MRVPNFRRGSRDECGISAAAGVHGNTIEFYTTGGMPAPQSLNRVCGLLPKGMATVEEKVGLGVDHVVSRSCRKGRRVVQCIPGSHERDKSSRNRILRVHEIRVNEWIEVVVRGKEVRYINGTTAPVLLGHRSPQATQASDIKQICHREPAQRRIGRNAAPLSADLGAQSKPKLPGAVRVSGCLQIDADIGIATKNEEGMCKRLEYMEGKSGREFGMRLDVLVQLQTISVL
ncbi:hypothetical protein K438DRAFT_1934640 [Mycena galopus ATCC 62051]|nr:hypothetical protein K438DRAFT_1934640 [Mycena galopus ATCC 62051]